MTRWIALVLLLTTGACWTSGALPDTTPTSAPAPATDGNDAAIAIGVAAGALVLIGAMSYSAMHTNDATMPDKDPCDDWGRIYDPNPEEHPCP